MSIQDSYWTPFYCPYPQHVKDNYFSGKNKVKQKLLSLVLLQLTFVILYDSYTLWSFAYQTEKIILVQFQGLLWIEIGIILRLYLTQEDCLSWQADNEKDNENSNSEQIRFVSYNGHIMVWNSKGTSIFISWVFNIIPDFFKKVWIQLSLFFFEKLKSNIDIETHL